MSTKLKVKALVDKEKNRILFAESDEDFIDVLFSFLTIPMGAIVSLTRDILPTIPVGCMNNLYASVQNLDVKYMRTEECKQMLLRPKNGAPTDSHLKIRIHGADDYYFYCRRDECMKRSPKILNHYQTCACGSYMDRFIPDVQNKSHDVKSDPLKAGSFLKGLTRLVISHELQLMHPSTSTSFSLLSKFGVMDASSVELRTFDIGTYEVLNLLKSSLVSKEPLTQTLLKKHEMPELSEENLCRGSSSFKRKRGEEEKGKIGVKLFICKSKKEVCFAEVDEAFVDLVFSFLTIPLGYVLKEMHGATIKGCIDNLYKSVEDLDVEKYFKSSNKIEMLLNPKLAPKFGYTNQLIGVEEASCDILFGSTPTGLTVKDPKIPTHKEATNNGGFVAGPAMYTVTDNLTVIPISPVSGVSVLSKLNVPFSDIEERVVHVGNKEAVSLLVFAFTSESALTNTFLQKEVKPEYQ